MKIASLFLVGFAAGLQTTAKKCNADNCARAVTGLSKAQRSQVADCSSFQQCTVVFPPGTLTTTTTIYTDQPGPPPPPPTPADSGTPTVICPTAVPKYASACSGTQRYSSACSCAGQTRSYTSEEPSTVVSTVTVYSPPYPFGEPCTFFGGPGTGDCGCDYNGACNHAYCQDSSALASVLDPQGCLQGCDDDIACQGFAFAPDGGFPNGCVLCYGAITVEDLVNNNDQWGYRNNQVCTGPAASSCSRLPY